MRMSEREIADRQAIDDIIGRSQICHLAMCDEGQPYIIPLNFGYDGEHIFFHGATEGRKIDVLKKNNRVCIAFEVVGDLIPGEEACGWSMIYESVIAFGRARILKKSDEKHSALRCIMQQYSNEIWSFPEHAVSITSIFQVDIEKISGKRRQ